MMQVNSFGSLTNVQPSAPWGILSVITSTTATSLTSATAITKTLSSVIFASMTMLARSTTPQSMTQYVSEKEMNYALALADILVGSLEEKLVNLEIIVPQEADVRIQMENHASSRLKWLCLWFPKTKSSTKERKQNLHQTRKKRVKATLKNF